jgi:hypothetical protein
LIKICFGDDALALLVPVTTIQLSFHSTSRTDVELSLFPIVNVFFFIFIKPANFLVISV